MKKSLVGLNAGTVKSQISRGRAMVAGMLEMDQPGTAVEG